MNSRGGGNWMILAIAILGAFVLAIPYGNEDYRIVCDNFVESSPVVAVLLLGIVGFTMGMAGGCLVAPRRFLEQEGRRWLYIWGAATVPGMRLRCLVVVAITGLLTGNLWYMVLHK